jgi:hypothetical protein
MVDCKVHKRNLKQLKAGSSHALNDSAKPVDLIFDFFSLAGTLSAASSSQAHLQGMAFD